MHVRAITLLTLLVLPLSGWSNDIPLFAIQRNRNANEVHYRLRVDDRCRLVSATPVDAVWTLGTHRPATTEPLTDLEHMAYGAVHQQVAENWVTFDLGLLTHFRPLELWSVKATAIYDPHTATCAPIVHRTINGQVAALERMYVQAEEGGLTPMLTYIDVFGKSLEASPVPVQERIAP